MTAKGRYLPLPRHCDAPQLTRQSVLSCHCDCRRPVAIRIQWRHTQVPPYAVNRKTCRRGRRPRRPIGAAIRLSSSLSLRGHVGAGLRPRPLPVAIRISFSLSLRASDRRHWRGNPYLPSLSLRASDRRHWRGDPYLPSLSLRASDAPSLAWQSVSPRYGFPRRFAPRNDKTGNVCRN